jgi:hypothetical protein
VWGEGGSEGRGGGGDAGLVECIGSAIILQSRLDDSLHIDTHERRQGVQPSPKDIHAHPDTRTHTLHSPEASVSLLIRS